MKYSTPEKAGISSKNIKKYIEKLEENGLATHDLIIAKGDEIVFEKYWAPFHKDYLHRMYSVSKSIVSLGVGFAQQDGLVNLDDPIKKYFPKECEKCPDEAVKNQTVREMLMMATSSGWGKWFQADSDDRVALYFLQDGEKKVRPSGTIFEYDSPGSFVLGAMVERLTGKDLLTYLREKAFDEIGVSKEAYFLKCPGGHSWGDSALLCTAHDLLKMARFTMNMGKWNGKQLLNEEYLKKATSCQIYNNDTGARTFDSLGYGYLIWRTYDDSFFFNGMGCQFAICVPHKDLIMIYNGDNQGKDYAKKVIFDYFYDYIVREMEDNEIEENDADVKALKEYVEPLKLIKMEGPVDSEYKEKINGVTYELTENPMGIKELTFKFNGNKGTLCYTNAQGYKELNFGFGENVFGLFPQEGYSDEVGSKVAPGNKYKCCASAAWVEPHKLHIYVQIVDKYFGNAHMTFSFKGNEIGVLMRKTAEYFLMEYNGFAGGKIKE
ncbi:MAG: serine hydrolase [Ruminococcaceae bacterium]|nr:serine hydrolase [Oscillospiraceae bacterium]